MKTRAVLALAVCALTPLVAAPRPAAAAGVNAIVQAVGDTDPFVFCWTDSVVASAHTTRCMCPPEAFFHLIWGARAWARS